jgi:hypothetical protein
MKVFDMTTVKPNMGSTKTYEDFAKFLGAAPHRLGIVSRMFPDLTASYLTESLMNIYTNQTSVSKFQSIDAFVFEWEIDVDFIKRVEFAAVPEGTGANGAEVLMAFKERYYEKYDTFRIEKSRQMCIVVSSPIRKSDSYWEVLVRLIDNDYQSVLDVSACQPGMQTRFITNYHPELSEEGYTKYQSNIERHRNHISTHRNDISFSSNFAMLEDVFISVGMNKGKGSSTETIYKMKKKEKELLDNFLFSRNNALLFGKSNVDKNGKPTIFDPHTNRPILMGDGIIAQIERYAQKYAYAKMSINVFDTVMEHMRQKSKSSTGNMYTFVINERLWNQVQRTLREYLKDWKTNGAFFYSQKAGKNVSVGATFDTYIFGGNQISFHVDKALTLEYPDKGYGLVIDLTADKTSAAPAMQMFTVKGGEFIRGVLKGVGGLDGVTSGEVSTPVAGSKLIHMGHAGVGVMNPYRSYIIEEQ